jgi:hypothetical protein
MAVLAKSAPSGFQYSMPFIAELTLKAEPVFRSQLRLLSLIDRKVPGLALQRQTRVMTAN